VRIVGVKMSGHGMEERLNHLEEELRQIRERNRRVELDKAWEVSTFRVVLLLLMTYVATAVTFWLIATPAPFLNALIPAVAYVLSTRTIPVVKRWWIERRGG
jgi:hypothetical protein